MHNHCPADRPSSLLTILWRGLTAHCPSCGHGKLYFRYLKLNDNCDTCQTEIGVIRADDMPAYVTIVIVGHIIVPLAVVAEKLYSPSVALHLALWLPLIVIMTLAMLPGIKGAVVGLMWWLGIRGDEQQ